MVSDRTREATLKWESSPTSPTQSTEVPEEAVEAAARGRHERERENPRLILQSWAGMSEDYRLRLRAAARGYVEDAAPALLKQGAEEERERIREALERAIKRLREVGPNEVHHLSVNLRLQVASELEELLAGLKFDEGRGR